jgi:RNA polymerase sigma-70 factor (ECF subfamily)
MPTDSQPSGNPTPKSLLERARADDAEAWRQLVMLYRPLVMFWCKHARLSSLDAEDVSQDIFAAVFKNLKVFRHDRPGDTFRGWLRIISKNKILVFLRRNVNQVPAVGGSDAWNRLQDLADPLTGCESAEKVEFGLVCNRVLEQVRGDFEEKTWNAFWLTVVEGRAPTTLTEELGMSADSIRQAKSRVLRRLKQEVGDLLE